MRIAVPLTQARVAALAVTLVVACHHAPDARFVVTAPRCYALSVGPWTIPPHAGYPRQRYIPPTPRVLVFEPTHTGLVLGVPREDSSWRLLRAESSDSAWNASERHMTLRGWRVDGDSLITVLTTPYGGLGMDFLIVGDSLLGGVRIIADITGLEYPTAPATAVRTSCPGR